MSKYVPPHLRGAAAASSSSQSSSRDSARSSGSGRWAGDSRDGGYSRGGRDWDNDDRFRQNGYGSRGGGSGRWDQRDQRGGGRWEGNEQLRGGDGPGSKAAWSRIHSETKPRASSRDGPELRERGPPAAAAPPAQVDPVKAAEDKAKLEAEERARHADLNSIETTTLETYLTDNSEAFRNWKRAREEGYSNKYIATFFEKKNSVKESSKPRGGAYKGANIRPIFTQFYKYAIDIDNGLAYSERARDIAQSKGECWFLDFGFAPGGMADLLLCADPNIKGVGVTLDPSEGGNVYLDQLNSHDRFTPYIGDVIDMARDDLDLKAACKLPDDFTGFDFVIVGITIHQSWDGENMNELKDLLHFAQLYFAFKYLKPGGMVMMRMHMSVRLVDCHFLSLMISMFNLEKFSGLEVGRKRIEENKREDETVKPPPPPPQESTKSLSKLDRMCQEMDRQAITQVTNLKKAYAWDHLDRTAVATKPFSTFSMRKTYWVLYHGFDCSDERRKATLEKIQKVLVKDVFAYGYNVEKGSFNLPILMDPQIKDLLDMYGPKMISVLEAVWGKQVEALEGFMVGLTDKFCRDGISCRRRHCNMAHRPSDMIPAVMDALHAVDVRAKPRLLELVFN